MKPYMNLITLLIVISNLSLSGCDDSSHATKQEALYQSSSSVTPSAAIAIPDNYGAEVAQHILALGGNAVDAATLLSNQRGNRPSYTKGAMVQLLHFRFKIKVITFVPKW